VTFKTFINPILHLSTMKPVKHAVSFVIYNKERSHVLSVLRPPDDEHLPDLWGLPAGTLSEGETFEEAVVRAGNEKLGVELVVLAVVGDGKLEREDYVLQMKEFEVEPVRGEPTVPQPVGGVTQYREWKWARAEELVEAARTGSLCSRIFLESVGVVW